MPKNKSKARGHHESRVAVCIVCFKKSDRKCSDADRNVLLDPTKNTNSIYNSIDINDGRVPSGICNSCRADVQLANSANDVQFKFPAELDIARDVQLNPLTRENPKCLCLICQIARIGINGKHPI